MATDNLYIKRSNDNELTREVLMFIDEAILDIRKFTRRKINIIAIKPEDLKKDSTKTALHTRKVRRLPALLIQREGVVLHGIEKIKEFYIKLLRAYMALHEQQAAKDRELVSDGDRYDHMFRTEMVSNTQENGGCTEDDEQPDFSAAHRDRVQRRNQPPPVSHSVPPAMRTSVETPLPPGGGPGPTASQSINASVMDSVKKAVGKTGGKDADLEMAFYTNLLEETPC